MWRVGECGRIDKLPDDGILNNQGARRSVAVSLSAIDRDVGTCDHDNAPLLSSFCRVVLCYVVLRSVVYC